MHVLKQRNSFRLNSAEATLQSEVKRIESQMETLRQEAKQLLVTGQKQAVSACALYHQLFNT